MFGMLNPISKPLPPNLGTHDGIFGDFILILLIPFIMLFIAVIMSLICDLTILTMLFHILDVELLIPFQTPVIVLFIVLNTLDTVDLIRLILLVILFFMLWKTVLVTLLI